MIAFLISVAFLVFIIVVIIQAIAYTTRIFRDPEWRVNQRQEEVAEPEEITEPEEEYSNEPEVYNPDNDETF